MKKKYIREKLLEFWVLLFFLATLSHGTRNGGMSSQPNPYSTAYSTAVLECLSGEAY